MVVVTGASGHVGAVLVRELLRRGRNVRALVRRDRRALEGLDIEEVSGDVLAPESLMQAFEGAETVYHISEPLMSRASRTSWNPVYREA